MTVAAVLERWSRVTPFGARFVDDQDGRVVADGLAVSAWPTAEPSRVLALPRTGGNAFYLMDAPGLRELSFAAGDAASWRALPRQLAYTFEVEDLRGRFHAFRFAADLPHRGLFRFGCGSPPTPVPLPPGAEADGVPLFTAPARPATPGSVVLRAELWDGANHTPAAWALLEARTPNARLRGEPPVRALADHRGRVAMHFPVPEEQDFLGGPFDSPTGGATAPLAARSWVVEVDAFYGALRPAPLTERRPTPPVPDLCAALNQPSVRLWDRLGGGAVELTQATLRYGQETFLESSDPGGEPPSVLLLTPSTSPP